MKSLSIAFLLAAFITVGCGDAADEASNGAAVDTTASTTAAEPNTATTEPAAEPAAELKGCAWISEDEATAALGMPMKYRSNDSESSNCILDEAAKPDGGFSVDFQVWSDVYAYDNTAKSAGAEELTGLGDKAVYVPSTFMPQIAVAKGTRTLVASFSGFTGTPVEMKERAEALGRAIAAKM